MTQKKETPKTVSQIVEEYRKRQETPDFSMLLFEGNRVYHNVTNFKRTTNKRHEYEFDSEWNGKISHVEISAFPLIKESIISETLERPIIAKFCDTLGVLRSGKRKDFFNVRNLTTDSTDSYVEFDVVLEGGEMGHMKVRGTIENYLSVPKGTDKISTKEM